jgi:hypothetical protein
MSRHWSLAFGVALALIGNGASAISPALATPAYASVPGLVRSGVYGTLRPASQVDLKAARPMPPGARPHLVKPQLNARSGDTPAHKQSIRPSGVRTQTTQPAKPVTAPRATSAAGGPTVLANFSAATFERQITWQGIDGAVAPPDPSIAAGPDAVLELTNTSASIWSKTGSLLHSYDLATLLGVPPQLAVSDPWAAYSGGQFFASAMAFDLKSNGFVFLAVSLAGDPTRWTTYVLKRSTTSVFADQPKLAISSFTGVTVVWGDFDCSRFGCPYLGEEIWVGKISCCNGALIATWSYGPDPNRYASYPAQIPSSAMDSQFLVFNASDPDLFMVGATPVLGLSRITGQPSNFGSMGLVTSLLPMAATAVPPDAEQAGGGRLVKTNDDRIIGAVLDNSSLWMAAGDACIPAGESAARACIRLIHVGTNLLIDQDFDVAERGEYLYFPALARAYSAPVNGFNNEYTYLVYNRSSVSESPGLYANVFPSLSPGNWLGEVVLRPGSGAYECSFCGPDNRWGDYSSAVTDPANSPLTDTDVWVAGEIADASSDRQNWSTSVARLTIAAPQIKTIDPAAGPATGGTLVRITGSDFTTAGTTVSFGGAAPPTVSVISPNELTATAPAQTAGSVQVTVTNPNGPSQPNCCSPTQFAYLNRPTVTGLSSAMGPSNVSTQVTISGTNLSPMTSVDFGGALPNSYLGTSDTQITVLTPVPHPPGTFHVTVTTPGGTSATGTGDQFTFTPTQPVVSSIMPTAGPSGGGTWVQLNGSGFNGATAVYFGTAPASSIQIQGDSRITAVAPQESAGPVDITVVSGSNTSQTSTADRFTYISLGVTSVSPNTGSPSGGTLVTLTGTGFASGTPAIAIFDFAGLGGTSTPLTVISDTQATTTTPPAQVSGAAKVGVCTSVGCSRGGSSFTYVLSVSGVSPASGTTDGGTSVTLSGSGLATVGEVWFGATPASSVNAISDTQVVATTPSAAPGTVQVSVSLGNGGNPQLVVGQFAYVPPRPVVTALKFVSGPSWGGQAVIITGRGFTWATAVSFGSLPSPAFHVDSDTQMTAISPPHQPGQLDVTVSSLAGTSATSNADLFAYSDCVSPFDVTSQFPFGAPCTGLTNSQYGLRGSDGATWRRIDPFRLGIIISPSVDSLAILSGNVDLWTVDPGYNQDIAITVNDSVVAWKESGGYAGTFSPNAAFVQTVFPMTAGHTYFVTMAWKTNRPAPGATIVAGAGPGYPFSPTRLTAQLVPAANVVTAKSTSQYQLTNSDGTTWKDVDGTSTTPLALTVTPPAGSNWVALLSGNIDLWTSRAGYNQDVGINVTEADASKYPGNIVAWKESGGFAGTFSPNAAFVQGVLPMTGGSTYHVKLQWKTNRPTFNNGATIFGAAGAGPDYSPTRLTAILLPVSSLSEVVSNSQFILSGSDGATWGDLKAGGSAPLSTSVTPLSNCLGIISGNIDLWTANAGFNQDIGILVSGGTYGIGQIVGWKESGGFAGTYSPNAAFVQAVVPLAAGSSYTLKLAWKTNTADAGSIVAGAGPWPSISGAFSPSALTIQLVDCS